MKNHFDEHGNYINTENLSLADIYHRAFAEGVESVATTEYTDEDIKQAIKENFEIGYEMAKNKFKKPTGEWLTDERGYVCSKCGALHQDDYPFCHMCGADMRVKDELNNELNELKEGESNE